MTLYFKKLDGKHYIPRLIPNGIYIIEDRVMHCIYNDPECFEGLLEYRGFLTEC